MFGRSKGDRKEIWKQLRKRGLRENPHLPARTEPIVKSSERAKDRMMVTYIVAAVSYGVPAEKGAELVEGLQLGHELQEEERDLLGGGEEHVDQLNYFVESTFAFAWAFKLLDDLDFFEQAPQDMAEHLPNLDVAEMQDWKRTVSLRPEAEIRQKVDEAYCSHWAIRDALLHGRGEYIPFEGNCLYRRWALEWLVQAEEWNDVDLGT